MNWELKDDMIICNNAHYADLLKCNPDNLYINWAAAMQIQFNVCDLDQSFPSNNEEWARSYIKHFVFQARKSAGDMITKFVIPFEKYIL